MAYSHEQHFKSTFDCTPVYYKETVISNFKGELNSVSIQFCVYFQIYIFPLLFSKIIQIGTIIPDKHMFSRDRDIHHVSVKIDQLMKMYLKD